MTADTVHPKYGAASLRETAVALGLSRTVIEKTELRVIRMLWRCQVRPTGRRSAAFAAAMRRGGRVDWAPHRRGRDGAGPKHGGLNVEIHSNHPVSVPERCYRVITIRDNGTFDGKPAYQIFANRGGNQLGMLYYYRPWQQYVVSMFSSHAAEEVFTADCLRDVLDFLGGLA